MITMFKRTSKKWYQRVTGFRFIPRSIGKAKRVRKIKQAGKIYKIKKTVRKAM